MSLTSGFYNAINSDRRYDAEQMSQIFDGIINDGIYDSIGTAFAVVPASGMTVNVGIGRAWLNHTWVYNDTIYPITLTASSASLGRKDVVCIKIDRSVAIRAASIVVIEGTSAASPVEPTIPGDDPTNGVWYHKLATITVAAGTTTITAAMIETHIGLSTGTPYVTGIIESTTFDQLWSQLEGEFMDWWDNEIKPVLNPEAVTRLQNNIDHITPKESTMRIYGFSHQNPPPSGYTYKEYSSDALFENIHSLVAEKSKISYGSIAVSPQTITIPAKSCVDDSLVLPLPTLHGARPNALLIMGRTNYYMSSYGYPLGGDFSAAFATPTNPSLPMLPIIYLDVIPEIAQYPVSSRDAQGYCGFFLAKSGCYIARIYNNTLHIGIANDTNDQVEVRSLPENLQGTLHIMYFWG